MHLRMPKTVAGMGALSKMASRPVSEHALKVFSVYAYFLWIWISNTTFFLSRWPFSFSSSWLVLGLLIGAQALVFPSRKEAVVPGKGSTAAEIFFYAYIAWSVITGLFGLDSVQTFKRAISMLLVFYFIKANVGPLQRPAADKLTRSLAVIGLMFSLISLFLLWKFPELVTYHGELDIYNPQGRFSGLTGNPNPTAMMSQNSCILGLLLFSMGQSTSRIIGLLTVIGSVIIVFLSASRGAILSLGILGAAISALYLLITFFGVALRSASHVKRFFSFLLVALVLLLLGRGATHVINPEKLFYRGQEGFGQDRSVNWVESIKKTWDTHPLYGSGLGNSDLYMKSMGQKIGSAHNMLVDTFVEGGLIGFWLMAVFLILIFRNTFRSVVVASSFRNVVCCAGMIAIFSNSQFEQGMVLPLTSPFFTFFLLYFMVDPLPESQKGKQP